MKEIRTQIFAVRLLVSITLCLNMSSCNGQHKTKDGVLIKSKGATQVLKDSLLQSSDSNTSDLYHRSSQSKQISNVVRMVYQDSNRKFWFGSEDGAYQLNGEQLIPINEIKSEEGKTVTIKDIKEDRKGNIWFGHTGGLSSFDGKSIRNYYERDGLLSNDVWCITIDKKNQVWLGTLNGVCKFDGKAFTAFKIPEGSIDPSRGVSSKKMIHHIMEDTSGRLWFSTNGGVYIKDGALLSNISESDGLKTNFVNSILEDKDGSFWIAASNGLYHYVDAVLTNLTKDFIVEGKGIKSVIQDFDGNIWFNSNLRDIYTFDGKDFNKYSISKDEYGPAPFSIYEDRKKRLWFTGFGGAYRYENDHFINITKDGPW